MATEVAIAFDIGRRTVSAAPSTPARYPARVARQLALAHALQARLEAGEFRDHADMARALGFTRARISQIMDLLLLAPDIQEEILFLGMTPDSRQVSGRVLRAVAAETCWVEQRRAWSRLCGSIEPRRSVSGAGSFLAPA